MSLSQWIAGDDDFDQPITTMPYAAFLGLRLRREAGRLITHMPYQEKLIGTPFPPRLHGGTIGALLEIAGAIEAAAVLEREGKELRHFAKPIVLTIDYLRAGAPEDVFANAEVKRLGRRIMSLRAEAWQDSPDRPIAAAQLHFLVVD